MTLGSTALLYFTHAVGSCCLMLFTSLWAPTATAGVTHWTNYLHISEQLKSHPDAFLLLVGDLNHADPETVCSKIHPRIDFSIWGNDTLDIVYTNRKGLYKGPPPPPRRPWPHHRYAKAGIQSTCKGHQTYLQTATCVAARVHRGTQGLFFFYLRRLEYV